MRKIDLTQYKVKVPTPDGSTEIDYNVKESLQACLFHPALKLDGREVLKRGKLSDKIEEADGSILLEEEDYRKVKQAFETIEGFQKADIELCRRVLECDKIEVEEKAEIPKKGRPKKKK